MRSSRGRRLELAAATTRRFPQGRRHAFRQHHRRPVRGAGDAREGQRVVGIGAAADLAVGELDIAGEDVELLRRDGGELVAHLGRAAMCAATAVPGEKRQE